MDEPPFGSIAGLLDRTLVTTLDGRELRARPHDHGALQVRDDGALLIDPLNDWSLADAFPVPLAPGRYRAATLRDADVEATNYGAIATCAYREGPPPTRWERSPRRFSTGTFNVMLILLPAFARLVDLLERESAAELDRGDREWTPDDGRFWNGVVDLCGSLEAPEPFWAERGFRFNVHAEGGDGVGFMSPSGCHPYLGLDDEGRCTALICPWIGLAGRSLEQDGVAW